MRTRILRTAALLVLLAAAPAALAAAGPIRGVWMHPGFFGPDEAEATAKIRRTLDTYVAAGIDTVIMLVKDTAGRVYFRSSIGPADPAYAWDFFGVFLSEARSRKMTVHPWFCVFPESGIVGRVREHPEWLIRNPDGELLGAANPALPEVRAYEVSLMTELVRTYAVDWIHLDYIRYPSSPHEVYFSWDPATRALFKAATGVDPVDIKARDSGNILWNEWISWNGGRVTAFVRELRAALAGAGRPVKISAAVFPAADKAKVLIGQDWADWTKAGLLDMLCPMLYTNSPGFFESYAEAALEIGRGRCLVCPGIGIGTSHNQNTPAGMMEQVGIADRLGADGVIFFSSSSLKPEFLAALENAHKIPATRRDRP
jgi:uncharacterized lipoprotein YddW (UPF0748 family)